MVFKKKEKEIEEIKEDTIRVKEVPSRFLPYPEDLEIRYKTYRYGDIKRESQKKYVEKETIEFVSKGIFFESKLEPDFSVDKLTFSDFLYISLLRKLTSLDTKNFELSFPCAACGENISKRIAGDELEFDELEIPKLPIVVKMSDKLVVKFNPLTVSGYLKLLDQNTDNEALTALYEQVINKNKVSYDYFYDLSIADGKLVDKIDELLYHGLKAMKVICKQKDCEHVNWVSVDSKETLIRPFRESEATSENRIRFGI